MITPSPSLFFNEFTGRPPPLAPRRKPHLRPEPRSPNQQRLGLLVRHRPKDLLVPLPWSSSGACGGSGSNSRGESTPEVRERSNDPPLAPGSLSLLVGARHVGGRGRRERVSGDILWRRASVSAYSPCFFPIAYFVSSCGGTPHFPVPLNLDSTRGAPIVNAPSA